MTDPFADDSWDELTRELGVEKSAPPSEPVEEAPAYAQDAGEFEAQSDDETLDGGLEPEGDAPDGAEAPGDEPQEPGKKRRRRRRRRRKGPGEGEQTEAAPVEATAVTPARTEPEYDNEDYETGPGSESDELAAMPLAADEDTAGEVLRDLIANWNVPSWDSIVTGLYRPER